jgi:hypothetical protein
MLIDSVSIGGGVVAIALGDRSSADVMLKSDGIAGDISVSDELASLEISPAT